MPRTRALLAAALLVAPAAGDAAAAGGIARYARATQPRLRVSAEPPRGLCVDDPWRDADGETQPFLILTSPRSGSTWMVETLANLPCVQATHEMFTISDIPRADVDSERLPALQSRSLRTFFVGEGMPAGRCEEVERKVAAAAARPHDVSFDLSMQIRAMRFRCRAAQSQRHGAVTRAQLRSNATAGGGAAGDDDTLSPVCPGVPRAIGFKWMLNQRWKETLEANDYAAARFLASIGVRIVRLVRRDLVAQAVSGVSMRQASRNSSAFWAAHKARTEEEARALADVRVTIPPVEMVRTLLNKQRLHREAEELFKTLETKKGISLDYVEVAYEDLIGDVGAGLRCAVKAFVARGGGRECGPLAEAKGSSHKIHKAPASEYVRNWNAVSAEVFKHPELRPLLRNDAGARDPRASEAAMASIVARDPAIARSCGMV